MSRPFSGWVPLRPSARVSAPRKSSENPSRFTLVREGPSGFPSKVFSLRRGEKDLPAKLRSDLLGLDDTPLTPVEIHLRKVTGLLTGTALE